MIFDKHFGRDASIAHTEKKHPNLTENYKKAQAFLKAVEQLRQQQKQQEKVQQKEKPNDRDYGMGM